MAVQKTGVSAQDFDDHIALPENADLRFEFIDGEIIEVPSNAFCSEIAIVVAAALLAFVRPRKLTPHRTNAQSIYDMLKKRGEQASVKAFSPHDLWRTFVGDMLDRGVDIATVANIAGHVSVDTTRRYGRRPEETKRKAANKLHFPY